MKVFNLVETLLGGTKCGLMKHACKHVVRGQRANLQGKLQAVWEVGILSCLMGKTVEGHLV